MALSYGEEVEPWIKRKGYYNKRKSRKQDKRERHRKLRRTPLDRDIKSLFKRYDGWWL